MIVVPAMGVPERECFWFVIFKNEGFMSVNDTCDSRISEESRSVGDINIPQEKFVQAFEGLAERVEAINALHAKMLAAEKKWRAAFSELEETIRGLTTDDERWAFLAALARLDFEKKRLMAAEDADIEFVYEYFYESEGYESKQAAWDGALSLDPDALREIFGESEAVDDWLATLEEPSVVRVVNGRSRKSVLHWRPGDEPVLVKPDRIGATQASSDSGKN